jgi:hypothetical protein
MKDGEGARDRDWERDRNMIPIPPPLLLLLEGTWHGRKRKSKREETLLWLGWPQSASIIILMLIFARFSCLNKSLETIFS